MLHAYNGRDPETKTRKLVNQTHRDSHAHLNKMLAEGDRGPELRFVRETLRQFLWLVSVHFPESEELRVS
jgi:hypothetical protein